MPVELPFQDAVETHPSQVDHYCLEIIPKLAVNRQNSLAKHTFTTSTSIFDMLIPQKYLPKLFRH